MPRLILCVTPAHHTYAQWDVIDIVADSVSEADMGSGVLAEVAAGRWAIIDVAAQMADVEHLKEPLMNSIGGEPVVFKERKYSMTGLPSPYYEQLIATGRKAIPLGVVLASQRAKA